jgi:hypothetical protein
MCEARFANVSHINERVRKRHGLPLDSLRRQITSGTYHDWKLCFRSEHCLSPPRKPDVEMCRFGGWVRLLTGRTPRRDCRTAHDPRSVRRLVQQARLQLSPIGATNSKGPLPRAARYSSRSQTSIKPSGDGLPVRRYHEALEEINPCRVV